MTKTKTQQNFMDSFGRAFDDFGSRVQMPEAARDFMRSQASAAAKRVEEMHDQASSFTEQAKPMFGPFAGSYETVTRAMIEASLANTQHYLATIEKLADANSVSEALSIQSEYVREATAANMERLRGAADHAKGVASETVRSAADQVKKAA